MTFINDPGLPATNNDAERARRHAVITWRICFDPRTDEDSRFDVAVLTVIETCRQHTVNIWSYAAHLIATARRPTGASMPTDNSNHVMQGE